MKKYGTTHRGRRRFKVPSKQDKYLHTFNLPHTHVTLEKEGSKIIKKYKRY